MDDRGRPVFPTKAEAAYPVLLCQRVAELVKQEAIQRGAIGTPPAYVAQGKQVESRANRRHGLQALPPLVAEYKLITDSEPMDDACYKPVSTVPHSEKTEMDGSLGARGTQTKLSQVFKMGDQLFGIYRSPAEFIEAALEAKHPIDFACGIPDMLTRMLLRC